MGIFGWPLGFKFELKRYKGNLYNASVNLTINQKNCEYCKLCIIRYPEYLEYRGKKKLKIAFVKDRIVPEDVAKDLLELCSFKAIEKL